MQKYEFLGLISFVLVWWLALFFLLWTAPSWTVADYTQPVNYCTPVYSTQLDTNESIVSYIGDCDFTCYFPLDNMDAINQVIASYDKCEMAETHGIYETITWADGAGSSCPYNRSSYPDTTTPAPPPSIEISLASFNEFYPLLGRFDTYLQLNRKEGEFYNGDAYDLVLSYHIVVTGKRINSNIMQLKTLFQHKETIRCPGNNGTCQALLLPAHALDSNYCADLGDYAEVFAEIFYFEEFSPLQPSLKVDTPVFNSTEAAEQSTNEYNILFRTTSYPFMYAIMGAHVIFSLLLIAYNIGFIVVTFKFLAVPFSRYYVERKWSIMLNLCSIFVGGDPLFFFLIKAPGRGADDGFWSYSTNVLIADQFMVNFTLGIILFLNLCFIANFRNPKYSEQLPWDFYFDKLIFLFVWVFVTICGTAVTTTKVHQAITSVAISHIRNAGRVLTWCLMGYYFAAVIIHTMYTARVLRGQWNFGVRHRQLGFRFMAWLQVMACILFFTESIATSVIFPDRISVSNYGAYTGFQTLFIDTFAFNIYVVCMVLATTWCYLPPGRHSLQDEAEMNIMTNHTHVRGTFSLYTAHKMVGCASVAYRDPPNTENSLRGVLDVDKYGITLLHFISVEATDIHCVVFLQDDELVVSFRGTASADNALTDLKANLVGMCWVPGKPGKHSCEKGSECRASNRLIHRGFNLAYASVRDVLLTKIRPLIAAMTHEYNRTQSKKDVDSQKKRRRFSAQPSGAIKCICIGLEGKVGVDLADCVCQSRIHPSHADNSQLECIEVEDGANADECDNDTTTTPAHARKHSRKSAVFRTYTTPDELRRTSEAGFEHTAYYGPGGHGLVGTGGDLKIEPDRGVGRSESAGLRAGVARGEGSHVHDQNAQSGDTDTGRSSYTSEVKEKDPSATEDDIQLEMGTEMYSGSVNASADGGEFRQPKRDRRSSLASLKAIVTGFKRKESIAELVPSEVEGEVVTNAGVTANEYTRPPKIPNIQSHDPATLTNTSTSARHVTAPKYTEKDSAAETSDTSAGSSANRLKSSASLLPDRVVPPIDDTYPHVFITGHSLGGSLATLFALDCAIEFPELKSTVYTFGSPRVGNPNFASHYNENVPHTFRVVNDGDVVTGVPKFKALSFLNITYKHVGTCYVLSARGDLVINPNFPERFLKVAATISPQSHVTAAYRNSIAGCIGSALRRQKGRENETMVTALETLTMVLQAPSYMCKDVDRDTDGGQDWATSHAQFDRSIASSTRRVARRQHTTAHDTVFTRKRMLSVRRRMSNFGTALKAGSDAEVQRKSTPDHDGARRRISSLPGNTTGESGTQTQDSLLAVKDASYYSVGRRMSGDGKGKHVMLSLDRSVASDVSEATLHDDAISPRDRARLSIRSNAEKTDMATGNGAQSRSMEPEGKLAQLDRGFVEQSQTESSTSQKTKLVQKDNLAQDNKSERKYSSDETRYAADGSQIRRRPSDGVDMDAIVDQVLASGKNVSFDSTTEYTDARSAERGTKKSRKKAHSESNAHSIGIQEPPIGGETGRRLKKTRSVRYKQSGKPLRQDSLGSTTREVAKPTYEHTKIALSAQQMAELEIANREVEEENNKEAMGSSLTSFVEKNVQGMAQRFRDSVRRRDPGSASASKRGQPDLESSMGMEMKTVTVSPVDESRDSGVDGDAVPEENTEPTLVQSIPQLRSEPKVKGDG